MVFTMQRERSERKKKTAAFSDLKKMHFKAQKSFTLAILGGAYAGSAPSGCAYGDGAVLDDMESRFYGKNTSSAAKRQRLYLKQYHTGEVGSVTLQWRMVH